MHLPCVMGRTAAGQASALLSTPHSGALRSITLQRANSRFVTVFVRTCTLCTLLDLNGNEHHDDFQTLAYRLTLWEMSGNVITDDRSTRTQILTLPVRPDKVFFQISSGWVLSWSRQWQHQLADPRRSIREVCTDHGVQLWFPLKTLRIPIRIDDCLAPVLAVSKIYSVSQ